MYAFLPKRQLQSVVAHQLASHQIPAVGVQNTVLRDACQDDIPRFGKEYVLEYVPFPYEVHHYQIFQAMSLRTGRLLIILMPRGYGKSTILFILILHAICYGTERYIVLIEHDGDIAGSVVQKFVKVFEENPIILRDFPDVRPATPWAPSGGELNFSNGVMLRCMGLNQLKSRGTTHHQHRITFAAGNDLVDLKNAKSPTETKFIYDVMTTDLAKAGPLPEQGTMRRCYIGTSISQTDAAWALSQSPMVRVLKIPAILGADETVKKFIEVVSNDARNIADYCEQLEREKAFLVETGVPDVTMEITEQERWHYIRKNADLYAPFFTIPEEGEEQQFIDRGPLKSSWSRVYSMAFFVFDAAEDTGAFMQERQHVTGDTAYKKFYEHWFIEYNVLPEGLYQFGMAIDTSGEPKAGTDPMAIVAGALHIETRNFYILEAWTDQATPEELLHKAHEIYWRNFRQYDRAAFVFLEGLVSAAGMGRAYFRQGAENMRQQEPDKVEFWAPLDIVEVPAVKNKDSRLLAMRPIAEKQIFHVKRKHSQQGVLVTQWCNWIPGTNTHKIGTFERKIDLADMHTLLYQNISIHSRPPVVLISPPNNPAASSSALKSRHKFVSPAKTPGGASKKMLDKMNRPV